MAYGKIKSIEDWNNLVEFNQKYFGKSSCGGAHYKMWREKYERDLEREESWLATNPQNTFRQARVAMLRKQVEEYRHYEELYP